MQNYNLILTELQVYVLGVSVCVFVCVSLCVSLCVCVCVVEIVGWMAVWFLDKGRQVLVEGIGQCFQPFLVNGTLWG